jgi:hypothetical protein
MRRKRSMVIYRDIMSAIQAVDMNGEVTELENKAEIVAKPYMKWI